jgi:threonine dehydratase
MSSPHAVTRTDVAAAHEVIRPHVRRTPVIDVAAAELGLDPGLPPVAFKCEFMQHSGSFKARGATFNVMTGDIPEAGVVAASGGNHGAALAFAARAAGVPCNIFVFSHSPKAKTDLIRGFGAEVHWVSEDFDELMAATHAFAGQTGAVTIHAYDAPGTLAGQGTVAAEFREQANPDTCLVAVGGGGLIGGIAAELAGETRLIAVEPEGCATLHSSLAAGRRVEVEASGVARDSLGPRSVGELMFPIAQDFVHRSVLVTDTDIRRAQRWLWENLRIVTEPGGATALAALMSGAYVPDRGERLGVVLCGANTDAVTIPV